MKAKSLLIMALVSVLLALAVGCSKKPNDAEIIGEVTQKIQADSNIQNKTIAVQSTDGVVTLTGTVASDMERSSAANDAGQVAGVRTVVNNLNVQAAEAVPAEQPVEQAAAEQPKSEPKKASARHSSAPKSSSHSGRA